MLDGCTCHSLTGLESKLKQNNISLIVIPPHSSNQTQRLDLGVFAAVKRYYMHALTVRTVSAQGSQVIRMFDAWIHGSIPRAIVNTF
jgi:hypothetical protein